MEEYHRRTETGRTCFESSNDVLSFKKSSFEASQARDPFHFAPWVHALIVGCPKCFYQHQEL